MAMHIFFDTEFWTVGNSVELISIGAVREDGEMFYAERSEFDWSKVPTDDWLQTHVRPHLQGGETVMTDEVIREKLRAFAPKRTQWWAYYGSYDWFAICVLMGGFMNLPQGWNKCCFDIKQYQMMVEPGMDLPKKYAIEHHALNDAHWNKQAFLRIRQAAIEAKVAQWDF